MQQYFSGMSPNELGIAKKGLKNDLPFVMDFFLVNYFGE